MNFQSFQFERFAFYKFCRYVNWKLGYERLGKQKLNFEWIRRVNLSDDVQVEQLVVFIKLPVFFLPVFDFYLYFLFFKVLSLRACGRGLNASYKYLRFLLNLWLFNNSFIITQWDWRAVDGFNVVPIERGWFVSFSFLFG